MTDGVETPLTGEQFVLTRGGATATISSLAGALRSYVRQDVPLVETFGADELPPAASGILLAPWPNRVADAVWDLEGQAQQLDITEVKTGNAIHGLLRNAGYAATERTESAVTLTADIFPQHGYPYHLTHTARYELDAEGQLTVTQSLQHRGALKGTPRDGAAPVALGSHPYLRVGEVPTDQLTLTTSATQYLPVDGKLIPTGVADAAGERDFRAGRQIDGYRMDTAFTGLAAAEDGRYHHRLDAPDGRAVELWADQNCPYVHFFITDIYPGREAAIAIEPMTAPANAFNTGDGLIWLEPGEQVSIQWGITSWL